MLSPQTVFFALAGGIMPALLWLWFWLKEDRLHPEPRGMIIRTFIIGMIAVPLVFPVEKFIQNHYGQEIIFGLPILVVFLWSSAEELFKLIAAYLAAMDTKEYDEPIDAVVYMITAALGFSAMENVFFLVSSISSSGIVESLITGNLRFIGATLLHVLSSGVIGLFIGLSFYKSWITKKISLIIGVVIAILLHTTFNIYIMKSAGTNIFIIFCFVWVALLLLITGFEKIKRLKAIRADTTQHV